MTRIPSGLRRLTTPKPNPKALQLPAIPEDDRASVLAETTLQPSIQAGLTIQSLPNLKGAEELTLTALADELRKQCKKVTDGDLGRGEGMLMP